MKTKSTQKSNPLNKQKLEPDSQTNQIYRSCTSDPLNPKGCFKLAALTGKQKLAALTGKQKLAALTGKQKLAALTDRKRIHYLGQSNLNAPVARVNRCPASKIGLNSDPLPSPLNPPTIFPTITTSSIIPSPNPHKSPPPPPLPSTDRSDGESDKTGPSPVALDRDFRDKYNKSLQARGHEKHPRKKRRQSRVFLIFDPHHGSSLFAWPWRMFALGGSQYPLPPPPPPINQYDKVKGGLRS
ncbi:hypothetical protein BaRGS_00027313 [Batillaria attramentaria]|uniref:Uncharacterized protein n=1 Tax=Batillaria attramentaria TaxID=370345 RepID=A0ABD0K243_9CAEN